MIRKVWVTALILAAIFTGYCAVNGVVFPENIPAFVTKHVDAEMFGISTLGISALLTIVVLTLLPRREKVVVARVFLVALPRTETTEPEDK